MPFATQCALNGQSAIFYCPKRTLLGAAVCALIVTSLSSHAQSFDATYRRQTIPVLEVHQFTDEDLVYVYNGTVENAFAYMLEEREDGGERPSGDPANRDETAQLRECVRCEFRRSNFSAVDVGTRRQVTQLQEDERISDFVYALQRVYVLGTKGTLANAERAQRQVVPVGAASDASSTPFLLRYVPAHCALAVITESVFTLVLIDLIESEAQQRFQPAPNFIPRPGLVDAVVAQSLVYVAFAEHGVDVYESRDLELKYLGTVVKVPGYTQLTKLAYDGLTQRVYALDALQGVYEITHTGMGDARTFAASVTLLEVHDGVLFDVHAQTLWLATSTREVREYVRGSLTFTYQMPEDIVQIQINDYVMVATTHEIHFFQHSVPRGFTAERALARISRQDTDDNDIAFFAYEKSLQVVPENSRATGDVCPDDSPITVATDESGVFDGSQQHGWGEDPASTHTNGDENSKKNSDSDSNTDDDDEQEDGHRKNDDDDKIEEKRKPDPSSCTRLVPQLTFYSAHKNSVSSVQVDVLPARLVCAKNAISGDFTLLLRVLSPQCQPFGAEYGILSPGEPVWQPPADKRDVDSDGKSYNDTSGTTKTVPPKDQNGDDEEDDEGSQTAKHRLQVCETAQQIRLFVRAPNLFNRHAAFVVFMLVTLSITCATGGAFAYYKHARAKKDGLKHKKMPEDDGSQADIEQFPSGVNHEQSTAPEQTRKRKSRRRSKRQQYQKHVDEEDKTRASVE